MREAHRHDAHPRHAKDGFHVLVTRLGLTLSQEFRHGMGLWNRVWFKTRQVGHGLLTVRPETKSHVTWIFACTPTLHMMAGASEFPFVETAMSIRFGSLARSRRVWHMSDPPPIASIISDMQKKTRGRRPSTLRFMTKV